MTEANILKLRMKINDAMRNEDNSLVPVIDPHCSASLKKETNFTFKLKPFVEWDSAELPVFLYRNRILKTVALNQITIINGGTGKYCSI